MTAEEVCQQLKKLGLVGEIERTGHPDYVRVFAIDFQGCTQGRGTIYKGQYSHFKWYVEKINRTILPNHRLPFAWRVLLDEGVVITAIIWYRIRRRAFERAEAEREEKRQWRIENPHPRGEGKRKPLQLNAHKHLMPAWQEIRETC